MKIGIRIFGLLIILFAAGYQSNNADSRVRNFGSKDTTAVIPYSETYKGVIRAEEGDAYGNWCSSSYNGSLVLHHIGGRKLRVSLSYRLCDSVRTLIADEDSIQLTKNRVMSNVDRSWICRDSLYWFYHIAVRKGSGGVRIVDFAGVRSR